MAAARLPAFAMMGAACYALRYPDLVRGMCGGDLAGCDWAALAEHFEAHGRAERRTWGCGANSSRPLMPAGELSPAVTAALNAPQSGASPDVNKELRKLPAACRAYHDALGRQWAGTVAAPHETHHELAEPPPLPWGSRRCPAWPLERTDALADGGDGGGGAGSEAAMRSLAAHWLRPFAGRAAAVRAAAGRNGSNRYVGEAARYVAAVRAAARRNGSQRPREGDHSRLCPLVTVAAGRIYLQVARRSALFDVLDASRCGYEHSEVGRLLVVLRFVRLALRRGAWGDFAFRLCVDDFCHGLEEGAPVAWFTMCACATAPTLPTVQWVPSAEGGRDPDLAVWDEALARRRRLRAAQAAHWRCKLPVGFWRGAAHNHHTYNARWSAEGVVERAPMSTKRWRSQGRLALVYQKCTHPTLLNVRVKLLTPGSKYAPPIHGDDEYTRCVRAAGSDKPRALPLVEQAARYQMLVHVEGNGGWADRLRHLLTSGAVVLRQEMGVVEWFEPLLQPWVHYVPVSSDLGNLSDAVRWVRANGGAARRMADAGAKLVDEALSARAMERYMRALLRGYAELHGGVVEPPTPAPAGWATARFDCAIERGASTDAGVERRADVMDCAFADPGSAEGGARAASFAKLVERLGTPQVPAVE